MKKYNLHLIRTTAEHLVKGVADRMSFAQIIRELDMIQTAFASDRTLVANLSDKSVPEDRRESALFTALDGEVREDVLVSLLHLLRNDALGNIKDLLQQIERLALERGDLTIAELKSATEMGEEEHAKIIAMLTERFKKEVVLKTSIDPKLIGGFTLLVEEKTIDASVAGTLQRLKRQLSE
ncbi:MAG: ATP synthase F1 subunit delta [bacterium]|nr:ATP synthase F1 subunit delta [bacterium]